MSEGPPSPSGLIEDPTVRRLFARLLRDLVDALSADHYDAMTQEPPLTARAGERLEGVRFRFPKGFKLQIITQDLPDRGRGALEKKTGTDLYVGIDVVYNGKRRSKGFLVQAKWDAMMPQEETDRLVEQCRKMLAISDHAYVWSYGPKGVGVTSARDCLDAGGTVHEAPGRDLEDVFDRVFECYEGDERIGLPEGERPRQGLRGMLERVGADRGLGFLIRARGLDATQR